MADTAISVDSLANTEISVVLTGLLATRGWVTDWIVADGLLTGLLANNGSVSMTGLLAGR